jgi:hypothetical protein
MKKTTGARKDDEHGPDDAAGKDEVVRKGDTIVVFHFHQGSTPWCLQNCCRLIERGENSEMVTIDKVMQIPTRWAVTKRKMIPNKQLMDWRSAE